MESKIINKYCQYCLNKNFDPSRGIVCSLEPKPIIKNGQCPNYLANNELIEREQYNKNRKKKFARKKGLLSLIGLVFCLGIMFYSLIEQATYNNKISGNYRYTLADVYVTKQSGMDRFLIFGGYVCEFEYSFKANDRYWYNTGQIGTNGRGGMFSKLALPIWPTKYIVKYNPEKPEYNKVLVDIDVEHLKMEQIPVKGIHADSLDLFLAIHR